MFRALMTSRRFAPLFWCQFFSAFNDNFVRNMLAMLILFRFGGENASLKILLATVVFILPAIPLSALGGEIANSHDKALIARRLKFAEIFVQMIAAAGFAFASAMLLYAALFGLGIIAALFGPIKYGILPDHLRREELVSGNALVEGATFAAIICGLIFGGLAAAQGRSAASVVAQLMLVALACYAAARFIPPTGVGAPGLKVKKNVFASTATVIRELGADDRQWVGAIGVSWFWTVGAVTLSLVPVIIKSRIGGDIDVEIAINLFFAVGVAAGSLAAAALSRGRIELAPAPFLLLMMAALAIDMGLSTQAMPIASREVPLSEFFTSAAGLRIAIEILLYSAAAGLFVVPIFAAIQAWAPRRSPSARHRRGQRHELHRDGRRIGGDHDPVAGRPLERADGAGCPRRRQYRRRHLFLSPDACEHPRLLSACAMAGSVPARGRRRRKPLGHWNNEYRRRSIMCPGWTRRSCSRSWRRRRCLRSSPPRPKAGQRGSFFASPMRASSIPPSRWSLRALVREARSGRPLVLFLDTRAAVAGQSMASFDAAALIAEKCEALVTPVRLAGSGAHFSLARRRGLCRPAPVPEHQADHPAPATAGAADRSSRPNEPAGAAPRAIRQDGRTPFPDGRHSTHIARGVRGVRRRRAASRAQRSRIR